MYLPRIQYTVHWSNITVKRIKEAFYETNQIFFEIHMEKINCSNYDALTKLDKEE